MAVFHRIHLSRPSRHNIRTVSPNPRPAVSHELSALFEELRRVVSAEYDDSGAIGRRYRRQDEIGTPWALTVDEQTLEDDTVTIRDRDSLSQERIPIGGAREHVVDRLADEWRSPKNS